MPGGYEIKRLRIESPGDCEIAGKISLGRVDLDLNVSQLKGVEFVVLFILDGILSRKLRNVP